MNFKDIAKGIGRAAANSFLDEYASASGKLGKQEGAEAARNLKNFVNGEEDEDDED